MKKLLHYIKWPLFVLVAIIPSVFFTQTDMSYNASPCVYNQVCQEKTLLTKKVVSYGFPAIYMENTEYTPNDTSFTGMASQGDGKNYSLVVANILFWLAALYTVLQISKKTKSKR